MAEPTVVLLILVAGASADRTGTAAVGAGVREALGADARVLLEERGRPPSDPEARELAQRLNASAIAELRWLGDGRSRAMLHVFVAADQGFYDREIAFAPQDVPEERERAVGLLVGAMVRAAARTDEPQVTPLRAPVATRLPPESASAERPSTAAPPPLAFRRFAADVGATSALAVGGHGSGLGPALGAYVYLTSRIAARASGAARFGSIEEASASTTTIRLGAGPAIRVIGSGDRDPFALDVVMEGVVLNHAVRRESPVAREDRWIGGAYAGVSAAWRAAAALEPFIGLGGEIAFGTTPIVIDGSTAATIPMTRLTGDVGVRFRF